jgi:hypothetical protein
MNDEGEVIGAHIEWATAALSIALVGVGFVFGLWW